MRQFENCDTKDILSFLKRLYEWRENGNTYNTQKSTESILDCLIKLTEKIMILEEKQKTDGE